MSLQDTASSLSSGTLISFFCLVLYSAGFVRIELKFDVYDRRLEAVEEVVAMMKYERAKENLNSNKGKELPCIFR